MARNVSRQADALATARERRRKLDRERDEKDERIEAATAAVLVALVDHADVARKLEQATADVGKVLKVQLGRVSNLRGGPRIVGVCRGCRCFRMRSGLGSSR